jgi:hypothetical protein
LPNEDGFNADGNFATSELDSVAHHRQNFSAVGQSQSLRPFIAPCYGDALIGVVAVNL